MARGKSKASALLALNVALKSYCFKALAKALAKAPLLGTLFCWKLFWCEPWFLGRSFLMSFTRSLLVSFNRIVSDIRLRWTSISMTFTLTMSPALTTSRGSLTNFSAKAEMWTRPSWWTPMSTNAPKFVILWEQHAELDQRIEYLLDGCILN